MPPTESTPLPSHRHKCDMAGEGGAQTAGRIVSVAAALAEAPPALLNTARYRLPWSAAVVVNEYVVAVAPGMSTKDAPPFELTCHCAPMTPDPAAAAMKITNSPEYTV